MRSRFGDCVFDADTREVFRGDRSVAVSPKAFALLELLIDSRPGAVSKAEIRERIWPDIHVSEANLANLVVELRAALGDDARRPRIIRTVPVSGTRSGPPRGPIAGRRKQAVVTTDHVYRLIWGRREIALEPGENLIGREREAVVWIDDESVSRRHARITIGPKGATIEDLGSKNGTYLAGRKIRGAVSLADRDVFTIGPAKLSLRVLRRTGSTRSSRSQRAEMTLEAGARLGPYEIRGLLGSGGMGEVYRARDSKLARDVAIKVLPPELAGDARRLERFQKEARTASALNHPNIVTVYDIGGVDGTSFIAMELVEGKTLRELLDAGPCL